jgi:hypothetical protein
MVPVSTLPLVQVRDVTIANRSWFYTCYSTFGLIEDSTDLVPQRDYHTIAVLVAVR